LFLEAQLKIEEGEKAEAELKEANAAQLIQVRKELEGIGGFYQEKIEAVREKRDAARRVFMERPARTCDLETIEKLDSRNKMLLGRLRSMVRELTDYRRLLVEREHEYDAKFGRSPNVAVAIVRGPRRSRPGTPLNTEL
jgi:hypothetical protein